MKKTFLILIAIMLGATIDMCAQLQLTQNLPKGKDVESVYVGKALFNMAGKSAMQMIPSDVRPIVKDIDGIEVYCCENKKLIKEAANKFRSTMANLQNSGKYIVETAMSTEEEDETVTIYNITLADGTQPYLVVYSREEDELSVIVISGKLDLEAIAKMAQK